MNSTTLQNFHKHIFDDQYIKDFFTYRDIGTSTQKTYRIRLGKYCQFTVQTPTQLIEEAKKDQIQINWIKERRLTRHLTGFKQYLQKNGKSYNTIKTYMATIKGFYHEFDIETPRIKIKDHAQKERITTKDIVGKEHIKNALKHANIKYRALILLMSSSGMGSAEIRHLTWEHFLYAISEHFKPVGKERFDIPFMIEKLRKKRNLILTWNIRRYKTGHPYTTFTTPEANMAFLDYLEDRHRENKTIRKIDDPLFLSGNTRIKRDAILKYFAYLNDTCKYGICGRSRFFTSQKLRKFFASTLNSHRVPENYTRWLLGHSDTRTVDRYVKPDLQSLKSEYTRLIPHLSIAQVKVKNVTTPEYDSLINKLDEKDAEFEEIKNETEVLKAIVEMYTGKKISELNRLDDKDNDQEPIDIEKVDLQRLKKEITKIGNKVTKS